MTARFRLAVGLAAYVALVSGAAYLGFSHWGYDDPYITYRYARNLAEGRGFVYNPGEYVLSTTTPLFTLLLVPFEWARGAKLIEADLPQIALLLGCVSLSLAGYFFWDLAGTWKSRSSLSAWLGLFLLPTFPLLLSTLGSETLLYLALCLGAFASYERRRFSLCAACAGLASLARPDGLLVAFLLGIDYLRTCLPQSNTAISALKAAPQSNALQKISSCARSIPWRAVLIFSALVIPWGVFAWSYFGSPLPATLYAKQQQGAMALSQKFAPGFLALMKGYADRWNYRLEGILALIGAASIVYSAGRRQIFFLTWPAMYFLSYTLLGVSSYTWYYVPLVPGFLACVAIGLEAVKDALSPKASEQGVPPLPLRTRQTRNIYLSQLLVCVIGSALVGGLFFSQLNDLFNLRQLYDRRLSAYRQVGEWLKINTPAKAKIGALEVGIIGYYSDRPMIDFSGLIQPQVAEHIHLENSYQEAARWAVETYRPDYLVLHQGYFPELEQGYVAVHCFLVKRFPGDPDQYAITLNVYACN